MRTSIFFVIAFFVMSAFAEVAQLPFDEKTALDFVNSKPNYANVSSEFASKAMQLYETNDLQNANNYYIAARFLSLYDKAKIEAENSMIAYVLSNLEVLENATIIDVNDNLENVFKILNSIWKDNPENFKSYVNLAFAIAIVFDTPPPEAWPHGQVSVEVLPRKFQEPLEAFKIWVSDRQKGRLLSQIEKLSIEELKFLVATVATSTDRLWAQRSVSTNVAGIAKLYSTIKYDHARLDRKAFDWEGDTYTLQGIKSKGGICTDQSYFTSEIAKAKGLPAFIFSGAGSDGFHAWVAYMQKSGKWNFSVGRFASGRFVTGTTIDPQTWQRATSHSLESLTQGFRKSQKYRISELHTSFANLYFINKKYTNAVKSANEAVKSDSRNFDSWKVLYEATVELGDSTQADKVCYNAMRSFGRSPDNDAFFRKIMLEKLSKDGKKAEAKKLSNAFVIKNKNNRPDLAMYFARVGLMAEIEDNDAKKLKSSYKKLFNIFKGDLAMTLNGIVVPVLQKLAKDGKTEKMKEVAELTRQIIKTSKDETISSNFENVLSQISAK